MAEDSTSTIEIDIRPDVPAARLSALRVDPGALRALLVLAVQASRLEVTRLVVCLVDDARMAELHGRHLNLPTTTDVLTFSNAPQGEGIDVDVAICLDEAARQAAARGHAVASEIVLYAVHGLLHGASHDDHDDADFVRMHAEEDRILTAIGLGPVFSAGDGSSGRRPGGEAR